MAESSTQLHEEQGDLSSATMDQHRAIVSLQEELEAVDWYGQRVEAAGDPELQAILAHNRDEEKEHAAMILEWLRRRDPTLDEMLRTYLFSDGEITAVEDPVEKDTPGTEMDSGSLGIGSLQEGSSNE